MSHFIDPAAVLAHAHARFTLPRIPGLFRPCRQVMIGKAYRMDRGYQADDYTGAVGRVVKVCADGDLEIELDRGGGVFVCHGRVCPIGPEGVRVPPDGPDCLPDSVNAPGAPRV